MSLESRDKRSDISLNELSKCGSALLKRWYGSSRSGEANPGLHIISSTPIQGLCPMSLSEPPPPSLPPMVIVRYQVDIDKMRWLDLNRIYLCNCYELVYCHQTSCRSI